VIAVNILAHLFDSIFEEAADKLEMEWQLDHLDDLLS